MNVKPFNKIDKTKRDPLRVGTVTLRKFFDLATCTLLEFTKAQQRGETDHKPAFKKAEIRYVDMVIDLNRKKSFIPVVDFTLHGCFIERIDIAAGGGGKGVQVSETIEISFKAINIEFHQAIKLKDARDQTMRFEAATAGNAD